MSQREVEATAADTFSEKAIADYLRSHPDFFERHGELLVRLRLPHGTSPSTISLVERQVAMLRERNDQLERRLKDLVEVAKLNDSLVERLHQLAMRLIRAADHAEALECIETALREDFSADRAVIVLFGDVGGPVRERPGFVLHLDREDPALKAFATFLRAAKTRCGPLRSRQKEVLFGEDAQAVGSAALIPLGGKTLAGFVVVGNKDDNYFDPIKSMDFLNRLGELIAVALELVPPAHE